MRSISVFPVPPCPPSLSPSEGRAHRSGGIPQGRLAHLPRARGFGPDGVDENLKTGKGFPVPVHCCMCCFKLQLFCFSSPICCFGIQSSTVCFSPQWFAPLPRCFAPHFPMLCSSSPMFCSPVPQCFASVPPCFAPVPAILCSSSTNVLLQLCNALLQCFAPVPRMLCSSSPNALLQFPNALLQLTDNCVFVLVIFGHLFSFVHTFT